MKVTLTLWILKSSDRVPLFVLILCILFTIKPTNLKNLIFESPKNIKPSLIWLLYYSTLQVNFQIVLCVMKWNVCVPLLNIMHKIYSKATIYVSGLILTLFSPFDIKCKKLNHLSAKNLWKWLLCEEPLEMVICVAINFKSDIGQRKAKFYKFTREENMKHKNKCWNFQLIQYMPEFVRLVALASIPDGNRCDLSWC